MKPQIYFQANAQKQENYFEKILSDEILGDICFRATGQRDFDKKVLKDKPYNKGRLLYIKHNDMTTYVSLSESGKIKGRNSTVQSVPTALNIFFSDSNPRKSIAYYFLPHEGNLFTPYHQFMYRLLASAGVNFLNAENNTPQKFTNIYDLIRYRDENKKKNKANNSTYITLSGDGTAEIFAKTFGANKYESTLIGIVCATIYSGNVKIYNICEQNLKKLPKASLQTLNSFGNIHIDDAEISLDRKKFNSGTFNLRSPFYLYNLFEKFGSKICACCGCPIPELVQGAHIWNVADIKNDNSLPDEKKYQYATSAENGIWLCSNHHKLFDSNILRIDEEGNFYIHNITDANCINFAKKITTINALPVSYITPETKNFIKRRNSHILH